MSNLHDAKKIIQTLYENGYEAYIVGGFVRDYLLNIENSDIDIATNALPDAVKEIFPKTILTGVKHGTVTVVFHNEQYEITTFRTDGQYINNRKPDHVLYVSSLEEDVKRRDFTMNALALTVSDQIIDYVEGRKDIREKVIRTVGNPFERFKEDALRMLRAFRFISTLGFSLDEDSRIAIEQNAYLLKNISNERVLHEFENMLNGKYFLQAINVLIKTKLHLSLPIFKTGLEKIQQTQFHPTDLFEFLTVCAVTSSHDEVNKLPISNQIKKEMKIVYDMYKLEIINFTKPIIFRNGLRNCMFTNKLNVIFRNVEDKKDVIINYYQEMPIHKQCDLKFKGDDIIQLYEKDPGGWISDVLDDLCLKVLMGEIKNDYEIIKNYLLDKITTTKGGFH